MRIAICGHGRAGKDSVGHWLNTHTTLTCTQSTSEAAADLVFREWGHRFYPSSAACFSDRHKHRLTWAELIWRHNRPDGTTLYRDMIAAGECVLNGIRCADELQACRDAGLIDLAIWIDRPGNATEGPSNTARAEDCDLTLVNIDGRMALTLAKLERVARSWGVVKGQAG